MYQSVEAFIAAGFASVMGHAAIDSDFQDPLF